MAKKLYKMTDGSLRWFDSNEAPENGAPVKADKPVEAKKVEPEEKAVEPPKNKAVTNAKTKVAKGNRK